MSRHYITVCFFTHSHPLNSQSFTSVWDTHLTIPVQKDLNHRLQFCDQHKAHFRQVGSDRIVFSIHPCKVISQSWPFIIGLTKQIIQNL